MSLPKPGRTGKAKRNLIIETQDLSSVSFRTLRRNDAIIETVILKSLIFQNLTLF
ncbi:hypothetical protein NIASO_16105 [Niabella soli DSM 19437]|uniref:Uncharacterized protein n=1 Tax=Niabella soli DSM 19437 TaxID=929713 RepID=W0F939_9BACT|nr:hypothetical protein NIASO_16105 [Niabella soli DSM 19437]